MPVALGPSIALRSTSILAQYEAARAGAGLAVLPAFVAAQDPSLVQVLTGVARFQRTFWMSMPVDNKHVARLQATWAFLREAVAAQGGHGDLLTGLRQAHAAIRLMDQISVLIQALDHRGDGLCRGIHVRTQEGKRNLLVVLLQSVNLGGIALHCGADAHHSYTTLQIYQPG